MPRALGVLLVALALVGQEPRAEHVLRVGGSTTLTPVIQEAARQLKRQGGDSGLELLPSTSQIGLDQLIQGRLDAALSGLPLPPSLTKQGYRAVPLALQAYVLVAHGDVPLEGLSRGEAATLFTKAGALWPGTRITAQPILRPGGTGTTRALDLFILSGETPRGPVADRTADLLERVAATPGAIGLAEYGNARRMGNRVRLLKLDGVACGPVEVRKSRYPLVEVGTLVHRMGDLPPDKRRILTGLLDLIGSADFQFVVMESQLGQFPVAWSPARRP